MQKPLASGVLCSVPTCKSSRRTHPTRNFYKFPLDEQLFEIWLEKCSLREAKKLPKRLLICEIHFDPMFKGKRKLLRNAIPIYYLTYPDVKIDNEPQSNQIGSPADSCDPFRSQTITDIIPIIPAETGCNKTAEYIPIHLINNYGDALENTNDINSCPEEIPLLREKYIKSLSSIKILTNKMKKFDKIINYYKDHIKFLMSEIEKYKMNVTLSKQVESLPNLSSAAKELGLTILNDSTKDWLCTKCRTNIDMALKSKETVGLDIFKLENNITSSCFETNEKPIKFSENVHVDDSAKFANFPSVQLKESSIDLNSVAANSEQDENEQVVAEPLLSDGLKYECEKCEEKHETYRQLIYHMRSHADLYVYECERCGKEFHMASKYRSHASNYKTERSFICNICKKGFKRSPDLIQHGYAHKTKRILPCPHCDKRFCHRKGLSQHLSNHREKLILCHMCDKKFLYNSQLKIHMELKHEIGSTVRQNSKRVKSDILRKQVSCPICAKLFTNKPCLNIHVKFVHNRIRPFSCSECEKSFRTSSCLKLHFQRHINSKTSSLDSETLKSYLKYKCNECDKAYTSPLYLKNHKIIHSGAKDHVCPDCGKGFAFKWYLKRHKRFIHETAHPSNFLCNICGKVSANVHALNAHMLSHTGEMPFHCKFCDSKFRYNKSLRLHVRNKHT